MHCCWSKKGVASRISRRSRFALYLHGSTSISACVIFSIFFSRRFTIQIEREKCNLFHVHRIHTIKELSLIRSIIRREVTFISNNCSSRFIDLRSARHQRQKMIASEAFTDEHHKHDDKMVTISDNEQASPTSERVETEIYKKPTYLRRAIDFYWKQEFLILVVLAIPIAKAYPELGAVYLKPELTADWLGVSLIFFMSGLGLRREELKKAVIKMHFNIYVLVFDFFITSSFVFAVSRVLLTAGVLNQGLADGLAICGSLPVTTNMSIVFTKTAGGNEAAAVFNTAVSNIIGVFLSPILIRAYVGKTGDIALLTIFWKLAVRVIVPLLLGNFIQFLIPVVDRFVKNNGPLFKRLQQYTLIYIVYTVFCKALMNGARNSLVHVVIVIVFNFLLQVSCMGLAWYSLKGIFPEEPKLRLTGLFACMHKTISIGAPLINLLFKGDPNLSLYLLPILIWHPMQLVVGTLLLPRLTAFVQNETARLEKAGGIVEDELNSTEVSERFDEGPALTEAMRQRTSIIHHDMEATEEGRAARHRTSIVAQHQRASE